jgi:hypothetical protein
MSDKRCATCDFWLRGTIVEYPDDLCGPSGELHPYAGQTKTVYCHQGPPDRSYGICLLSTVESQQGFLAFGEDGRTNLITDASFGCVLYKQSTRIFWDHFDRIVPTRTPLVSVGAPTHLTTAIDKALAKIETDPS